MPPQGETANLLPPSSFSFSPSNDSSTGVHSLPEKDAFAISKRRCIGAAVLALVLAGVIGFVHVARDQSAGNAASLRKSKPLGAYELVELQVGKDFFSYYDFLDGPDSLGSAGYNVYVGEKRAMDLGIANVTEESGEKFVYMSSKATVDGPRESVRLEGKRRFNDGLFILDVRHMPAGCGQWPAFWLTDEDTWPDNGEIDIVEGINNQSVAKTALHTSPMCSMYAHVPRWAWSGHWDSATGLPDTFTGELNFNNSVEADDCWVMAPHQWANQGCVAISGEKGTIGQPLNDKGGGIYVLEWDPDNRYIRSWVFTPHTSIPENLKESIETAAEKDPSKKVMPNTTAWGVPYAYFAIGETTGCSKDHFKNMRIVFNLAFCGSVSGNRFFGDCPAQAKQFNVDNDPIRSCNAYIESEPEELAEAYWKVAGVYVYQRRRV